MSFYRKARKGRVVSARTAIRVALVMVVAHAAPTSVHAQESKGVHVCLGTDNLLRFTSGPRCPQGQRLFRLA